MHIYLEALTVQRTNGTITSFKWRSQTFTVRRIVDTWTWRGRWWDKDSHRTYHLVDCYEGVVEVYFDGHSWTLSRVVD